MTGCHIKGSFYLTIHVFFITHMSPISGADLQQKATVKRQGKQVMAEVYTVSSAERRQLWSG